MAQSELGDEGDGSRKRSLSSCEAFSGGQVILYSWPITYFDLWPNSEGHSQVVRFVSSLIADGFVGIARTSAFMGVGLHANGGDRRSKCLFCPTWECLFHGLPRASAFRLHAFSRWRNMPKRGLSNEMGERSWQQVSGQQGRGAEGRVSRSQTRSSGQNPLGWGRNPGFLAKSLGFRPFRRLAAAALP